MGISSTIGASLISGASGLLGGLLGSSASSKAAKAQLQATRETNATNLQIARENNEYNSVVNQRKRLEEAGLNPNLMLDGSANVAASEVGQQQVPDTSALAQSGQILGDTVTSTGQQVAQMLYNSSLQKAQAAKTSAEAEGILKDNTYKDADYAFKFAQLAADTNQKNKQRDLLQWELNFKELAKQNMLKQIDLQNSQLDSQTKLNIAQTAYEVAQANKASLELKWLPQQLKAQIDNIVANTLASQAAANASNKQAALAVEEAILTAAQTSGVRIDNEVQSSAKKYSIHIIQNTAAKIGAEARTQQVQFENQSQSFEDSHSWINWLRRKTGFVGNNSPIVVNPRFKKPPIKPVTPIKGFH